MAASHFGQPGKCYRAESFCLSFLLKSDFFIFMSEHGLQVPLLLLPLSGHSGS